MNAENRNSEPLASRLCAVSFAVDDLRLYLDTHPEDTEAAQLIGEYLAERKRLADEYRDTVGCLEAYDPDLTSGWNWNSGPMPWKG